MAARPLRWGALLVLVTCASSVKMHTELHLNPIRRVVSLLQMMQKKVSEEAEQEKKLFDQFMCNCHKSEDDLGKSISEAEAKIPKMESDASAGDAEKAQLTSDISQAQDAKAAAEKTMTEAKSMRGKEGDAYEKQSAEDKVNLASLTDALGALRKGTSAAFLQTSGVDALRHFMSGADLPEWDRKTLTSFLASSQASGQSDEDSQGDGVEEDSQDIIGILSQMKETLEKDMKEAKEAETRAATDYDSLVLAKTKELETLNKELEVKNGRLGEVGVELVNIADDLADTKKVLDKDKTMQAELQKDCMAKSEANVEQVKTRQDELLALSDTIDLLNDDDALHLFKKSLPTPSLMQVQMSSRQILHDARQAIVKALGKGPRDPRLDLITMAMRSRKGNFEHVLTMIDQMVVLLGKEQKDDEQKVKYCKDELDKAGDEKTTLEASISDSKKTIANSKEILETFKADISKLAAEIKALGKTVAAATLQRKSENAAFVEESASNHAAVDILNVAKNRLNKFYNPKQYSPSAASGASALQSAFSFLQVRGKDDSNSVIKMLSTLIADISKQVAETEAAEKTSQADYEQFMKDSSGKHAELAKALSAKESAKAEMEVSVQRHGKELKSSTAEAMANGEYLESLGKECDWMMKNFKTRQEARTSEVASLKQAQAVLNGADVSFLQVQKEAKRNLRRVSH